jgi:hypothetical protein
MKNEMTGWRPHLLDPTILGCAPTRVAMDRGPLHCSRPRGSLSVPCSPQALMPDDASLAALGADFAVGNNFFKSTLLSST